MRPILTLSLALGFYGSSLFAQNAPDFWTRISPDEVVLTGGAERQMEPLKYTAFKLDYQQIATYLTEAPKEFTPAARAGAFRVVLPLADGKKETFAVVKTRVIAATLEAQHPEIGTYSGESLSTPHKHVRITVTPGWGFRAMIMRADKGVEYIEPVAEWQNQYYMVYDRVDIVPDPLAAQIPTCKEVHAENSDDNIERAIERFSPGTAVPGAGEKLLGAPVSLRVYRFACATTGEFSQHNGGTKDLVFQKLTTLTNQLNGIFERDVNTRLELIAESYNVIFLDPDTDPYNGTQVSGWMAQNPTVLAQYIGSSSLYDIGQVFARYLGGDAIGIAYLSSCCTLIKGGGCSSWTMPPYGDEFLGIAAHEIGHQWSAGHTFNQCNPGDGFSYESACEPGGGNSLLGYNSCGSNNTTGGRSLYYHACSIAQIRQFVETEDGATCGTSLATSNTAPMVSTSYPALTYIPINTPFELTGTGIDPDGDALTYTWDETDLDNSTPLGSPVGNSPIFRWYEPTSSPTRTFPNIQTIVANTNSVTEVLPSYNRDIKFAFVARDNRLNGGGVASTSVKLKSTTQAGPFLVSYPNAANIAWKVGEYQTVLWDVANTNNAPVNAKIVNIKLSTDNGLTYPVTLATGVPNIGKYCIQVPDNLGTNNRIRVEAADNVFFDISNVKFSITQPTTSVSLCAALLKDYACLPGNYTTQISTIALAGFTDPISLSASGLPNGASATFSPNPVQPGSSSTLTISFPNNSTESTFDVTVLGNAGTATVSSVVTLTLVSNDFSAFGPKKPINGAVGVNQQPPLYWKAVSDADFYDVELATNPSFDAGALVASRQNIAVDSFQVPVVLEEGKVYYWRVRAKNDCGVFDWTDVQVFVVAVQNCATYEATDLPKNITANGTPTVESKITLSTSAVITDVNVKKIQGNHTFFKDLEVHLISPMGTDVLLWKDKCASNVSFNIGMDDGASGPFGCPPPNTGVAYKPVAFLGVLNGESSQGTWTLRVKDNVISYGGTLSAFELEICSSVALNPPMLIVNTPLTLNAGTNASIGDNLLKAEDLNNGPSALIFTLISLPVHGQLLVNGVVALVGSQFSQSDISSGGLRYYDYGLNLGQDAFNFSVTDGEGGLVIGTFLVQPTVGTHEPDALLSFDLAPNPANAVAVVSLNQPLTSDAHISLINSVGQIVESWQLAKGAYALRMELNNLPKGVYVVSLENEKLKSVKKLVIY